jgi:hypothetical protein
MPDPVSRDEILARWAYSELLSLSLGDEYDGPGVPELKDKARRAEPFDTLVQRERDLLIKQLQKVRYGNVLQAVDGITHFKRVCWTRDQLAAVYVILYFADEVTGNCYAPVTFQHWIKGEPRKSLNQWHARYAALAPEPPSPFDPVLVGRLLGLPRLVDGYHRAVRFWSKNDPIATIPVYEPLEEVE